MAEICKHDLRKSTCVLCANERADALAARLAEELENKKQFERDWLEACDKQSAAESRLERCENVLMLMRVCCACPTHSKMTDAALRPADSASTGESENHE